MRLLQILTAVLVLESCATPSEPVELPANTSLGLRVWATVTPQVVRLRDSAAVLHIRVRVRNPADSVLRIVSGGPPYLFTSDPADGFGMREAYRIGSAASPLGAGPGADYWGDSVYVFDPRSSSVVEIVLPLRSWRAGGWPVTPGEYRVRSYFNGREGESATFTLVP